MATEVMVVIPPHHAYPGSGTREVTQLIGDSSLSPEDWAGLRAAENAELIYMFVDVSVPDSIGE